ncbi:hypothetical protein IKE83_00495 [Candidatus Saccharibacteria bacterium]|nr:hypothetical protein [Candidatus Saccharibacteria bacterium]
MGPAQNGFSSNLASFPPAYSAGPIVSGGDGAVSRPDAGKKKRTWAIVAGIGFLILAVALAVVAVVMNANRGVTTEAVSLTQNFENLEKYIEGDENNDDGLIAAVKVIEAPEEVAEYYRVLDARKEAFAQAVAGKVGEAELKEYEEKLKVLGLVVNYRENGLSLLEYIDDEDYDGFEKYYNDKITCEAEGAMGRLCELAMSYYGALVGTKYDDVNSKLEKYLTSMTSEVALKELSDEIISADKKMKEMVNGGQN